MIRIDWRSVAAIVAGCAARAGLDLYAHRHDFPRLPDTPPASLSTRLN